MKWISVKSKVKPKSDLNILLWIPSWKKREYNPMPLGYYSKNLNKFIPNGSHGWDKAVTHWRYLPDPPKKRRKK